MLNEILEANVYALILVFARIGTAMALLPGFSAPYVPIRVRLVIGMVVSFALVPVLVRHLPGLPTAPLALGVLIVGEVVIGGFMASIARIIVSALQTAGTFVSYFAAMANALIQDPIAEQQSSTVAGFLATTGVVAVFAADLHHVMLRALVDSYVVFQPGVVPMVGDMSAAVTRRVADAFALGLQLAAPFLLVALTYYIGLGLLGRLMPTLQVFFVGLPFQIAVQIWVLMVTLSGMMIVFLNRFAEGYAPFVAP